MSWDWSITTMIIFNNSWFYSSCWHSDGEDVNCWDWRWYFSLTAPHLYGSFYRGNVEGGKPRWKHHHQNTPNSFDISPVTEVKISPSTIHICSSAGDTTKGADSGLNGRTCLLVIFHRTLDSLESLSMSLPYWSAINFIAFSSSLFCFLSSASSAVIVTMLRLHAQTHA